MTVLLSTSDTEEQSECESLEVEMGDDNQAVNDASAHSLQSFLCKHPSCGKVLHTPVVLNCGHAVSCVCAFLSI